MRISFRVPWKGKFLAPVIVMTMSRFGRKRSRSITMVYSYVVIPHGVYEV